MATLQQFVDYLEEQAKNRSIYVWGGQGEDYRTITEAWIQRMEDTTANANRAIAFWKKQVNAGYEKKLRAFDCSGLGIYFLYNLHKMVSGDMTAHTLMSNCTKLARGQIKCGDWVFRVNSSGRATHIGYVVDNALNVIEAKGRDDGVVKRGINANGSAYWNAYGRPKWFKAEIEKGSSIMNGWKDLKNGDWEYYRNGQKAKSYWVPKNSKGKEYYLGANGLMAKSVFILSTDGKKAYWVGADGAWDGKTYPIGMVKNGIVLSVSGGKCVWFDTAGKWNGKTYTVTK